MKRQITLFALAVMTVSAFSQQSLGVSPQTKSTVETAFHGRTVRNNALDRTCIFSGAENAPEAKVRIISQNEAKKAPSDYGTEVTILYEDFSKFSTGTLEAPDVDADIHATEFIYPWINVSSDYTTISGWGAENVYPAGGTAYLGADEIEGQAHINTPMLDVSGYCGIVFVRFNARTLTGTAEGLWIEGAETFNMAPSWDMLGTAICPTVTDEWRTYEATFYGGGEFSIFNIVQTEPGLVFIDDVRVYQIDQYVATPVTLLHSNYKGTSFDANWKAVEGAESYSLTVFSYDEDTQSVSYLMENQKVEGTSYTVEGTVSGKTYYYTLHSVKGNHVSMETAPVEVFDLEAPKMNPVNNFEKDGYTASWNEVPTADVYNYWAYCERVAGADGEFVITDENFDGVKDADGQETGWTIEEPLYQTYDELYLADLKQAGWRGLHYAPYTDYICVDGWWYNVGGSDAGLLSPELDLSKDGGKVNMSVKLYGEFTEGEDFDGNHYALQTQAAIALFNYDEEKGDFVQSELIYPEGIKEEWGTYNITFTKGSRCSVIGIYAVAAPGNLYIDDLKITQNYKKGEILVDPFFYKRFSADPAVDVKIPERTAGTNIFHKVSAMKSRSLDGHSLERKESVFSALEFVGLVTSVQNVSLTGASVAVLGGTLNIVNPLNAPVGVYDISGTLIYLNESGEGHATVDLPGRGAYLVRIGSEVMKVMF